MFVSFKDKVKKIKLKIKRIKIQKIKISICKNISDLLVCTVYHIGDCWKVEADIDYLRQCQQPCGFIEDNNIG